MAATNPAAEKDDKEEHKRLARFVKGVHADLRKKFKANNGDYAKIWDDHCQNKEVLAQYADAMHHLALDHWSKKPESRIDWCRDTALEFFHHGGLKQALEKDVRKYKYRCKEEKADEGTQIQLGVKEEEQEQTQPRTKTQDDPRNFSYNQISLPFAGKVRLLDVGSCYNPFEQFDEFLAIGIDISPAKPSVYHCDFLHLETTDPLQVAMDTLDTYVSNLRDPIERLPRQIFHVVVFSLLLEYLPSAYQRWLCCQKAHSLLMLNGLLLIVTPDSHQQHRNAAMMKSWRVAIESMGFQRWRYIKLDHIHCMAFRKVEKPDTGHCLVEGVSPDMLHIPQDYNNAGLETSLFSHSVPFTTEDEDFFRQSLQELPHIASDDEDFL
ncbi:S-adenosylmethionine sensor upstream of mTORC1-like isoform X1 [Haliotis asinina]|uniref:S-adenosylmethionine sensor upstream of mTORC1-like isoform X1 n=1 Tax=Haliotis asinina TaxID=109174 RepID=UPI0035321BF9